MLSSTPGEAPAARSQVFALAVLAGLAVLTPWPFGSVAPEAVLAVAIVAVVGCAVALGWGLREGVWPSPAVPLSPLLALLALGLFQLVPLPAAVHAVVAPGSHAVWLPASPEARAVLGEGPHPLSVHPAATWRALLLGSGLCGLALLGAPVVQRGSRAIAVAAAVTAGGTAVAVYGVVARARFGNLLYGSIPVPTVAPFGPFVSKNHFAGYVAMTALLALGLAVAVASRGSGTEWTTGRRSAGVVGALVAALAMALAVLVSLSRGGVAALTAGAIAFLAIRIGWRRRGRRLGPLLPALTVAILLAGGLLALLPLEARERLRSSTGSSLRMDIWRDTVAMASSSLWMGHGLGSFEDAYPRFKRHHGELRVEHAENDYLETLAEAGLLGLACVLAAVGSLAARALSHRPSPVLRGLGAGALAGLSALLVHSAFDFNLRIPSNATLAALLACVALAAAPRRVCARAGRLAAAVCFTLSALITLARADLRRDGSQSWQAARDAARLAAASREPRARALHLDRVEQALRTALRQRPAHAEAWLLLAGARAERGDASAGPLARHAVSLDPRRAELRASAERLAGR